MLTQFQPENSREQLENSWQSFDSESDTNEFLKAMHIASEMANTDKSTDEYVIECSSQGLQISTDSLIKIYESVQQMQKFYLYTGIVDRMMSVC